MDGDSGAVARRGVSGRVADISVGRAGRGLSSVASRPTRGGFIMIGGSITRGAMLLFIGYWNAGKKYTCSGPLSMLCYEYCMFDGWFIPCCLCFCCLLKNKADA